MTVTRKVAQRAIATVAPYRGELFLTRDADELIPVLRMELEPAVAAVVAAEAPPGAAPEALKALAVVVRSQFSAGRGRHAEFDFCDTTHCQFLRSDPKPAHPASLAARGTAGLVIEYSGKVVPAMYSASCGGHTLALADVGMTDGEGYPYYAVATASCQREPDAWTRRLPRNDLTLRLESHSEAARIHVGRRYGWAAVPSNQYTLSAAGAELVIKGAGHGHGIGLCERGAAAMAKSGADFRAILEHYFPNTRLVPLSKP